MKLFLTKIVYFIFGVIATFIFGTYITVSNADSKKVGDMSKSAINNIMNS